MTFASFIETTFNSGQVVVDAPEEISDEERRTAATLLIEYEKVWRTQLPAGLPEFQQASGIWAAELLYRSAQFLAHRDVNVEFIDAAFSLPMPEPSPAAHYSVDLTFRYLCDIWRFAGLASSDDPFSERIVKLVEPWPLSSVGFDQIPLVAEKSLLEQPALRRMYVDRIIAQAKPEQVTDTELRELIASSVGAFPQLAPTLAELVTTEDESNETES